MQISKKLGWTSPGIGRRGLVFETYHGRDHYFRHQITVWSVNLMCNVYVYGRRAKWRQLKMKTKWSFDQSRVLHVLQYLYTTSLLSISYTDSTLCFQTYWWDNVLHLYTHCIGVIANRSECVYVQIYLIYFLFIDSLFLIISLVCSIVHKSNKCFVCAIFTPLTTFAKP